MTEDELRTLINVYGDMNDRLKRIESLLLYKLKIEKIIDIGDDKVHKVMTIIKMWETPAGVMIHVK